MQPETPTRDLAANTTKELRERRAEEHRRLVAERQLAAEAREVLELAIRGALWDLRPTKAKEEALLRLLRLLPVPAGQRGAVGHPGGGGGGAVSAREVEITRDDDVMVFGGGFGGGSEVVGTIEPAALDGDMVLVHLTEANPAEGEAPERLSVLIPKEALRRIVASSSQDMGGSERTAGEGR